MQLKLRNGPLAAELGRIFPDTFSVSQGIPCRWQTHHGKGYATVWDGREMSISIGGIDDLLLALGDLLTAGKPFTGRKAPPYHFRGIMLDASRNAVPRIDFLKERIARLALMGLNHFCLYTEDVYPVPDEPLFGYARGRYTAGEIRELVRYGKLFGVVVFPCIQTLGHMEHILKYPHYHPLKDNEYVYNVQAPEIYAFIEKTIDAARSLYDTNLIHVGMDETFGLGRGLAFREGEKIRPRALYIAHVRKVAALCRKKGLRPIMWGDIVLGSGHGSGGAKGMGAQARSLPKDVIMNHWNYARCDAKAYGRDIAAFKKMGYAPMLSPGIWSWSRFFPTYSKAESNISTLLEAGKKAGLRQALNTHWGDDGHECFFDLNLPAHAYFLAKCTEAKNARPTAEKKFAAVFAADFKAVAGLEAIETAGIRLHSLLPANAGKCFFYDDPAQGLFTGLPFVRPAGGYYRSLSRTFARKAGGTGIFPPLFQLAAAFCDFLSIKSDLRRRAVSAYRKGDKRALSAVMSDIGKASRKLDAFRSQYRGQWLTERSPFGLEIIEGRMGALSARLDSFRHLLNEHLLGRRPRLEELEFRHYSMFHASRDPDYQPGIWPEFFLHYSALASRNLIKWW